ncbi:MAG: DNA-directed RNA polymerase subunit B, partial [Candidatus Aenigmarchaeota archaeon]|nr:DNA-directed RNA polymerase subunit B [Candidatus Aenigmarchaeota archaeon]
THWGRFCPAETPEGPTIGLRKHLALFAEITKGIDDDEKKKLMSMLKFDKEGKINVYLDGVPIGLTSDGKSFVENLREKRRTGKINNEINFVFYPETNEVRVSTDSGRVRRPLAIIENNKTRLVDEHLSKLNDGEMKWNDLIKSALIEYIDSEEEDSLLIALTQRDINNHTHLEFAPIALLGISSSLVVFPEHNRGDRVNLGAKMLGQAVGIYQNNFLLRTDTKSNILVYPQMPLVNTDTVELSGLTHHPSGQNVVVAILSYHGYNMEDAVVFNRDSIDRGMFRSLFYRIYPADQKRYWGGQEDLIGVPDKDVRGFRTEDDYTQLAEDGIISPETPVVGDGVLVGRMSPLRFLSANELMSGISNMRENSVCVRHSERGVVDRVILTQTANGVKLVKVAVRDLRIPELGDKFASRHGQKSVIGLISPGEDMPFTSTGLTPDIILNPHSVPSRQTIGQLLEVISGKTSALDAKKIDGSAFRGDAEKEIRETLGNLGFRSDGKEVLYNGITGEKYDVEIYTGMIYYQKLDHMVANKIQSRSRGPVTLLTRQPTEGKTKEGGLRLGEMEKDCLIAHGAVLTLKERFDSDKIIIPVCKECGLVAVWDRTKDKYVCPVCKEDNVVDTEMSYAFKLLLDELKAMLIYPKVNVSG